MTKQNFLRNIQLVNRELQVLLNCQSVYEHIFLGNKNWFTANFLLCNQLPIYFKNRFESKLPQTSIVERMKQCCLSRTTLIKNIVNK